MAAFDELEYYRKNSIELLNENNKLKSEKQAFEAKNWNLGNKLKNIEAEVNKLKQEINELKADNSQQVSKILEYKRNEDGLLQNIKSLEFENIELKNTVIRLKQQYKEQLTKYYEQCKFEIARARSMNKRQEIIECLQRNNGNKAKTAAELGISRQALYKHLNKI